MCRLGCAVVKIALRNQTLTMRAGSVRGPWRKAVFFGPLLSALEDVRLDADRQVCAGCSKAHRGLNTPRPHVRFERALRGTPGVLQWYSGTQLVARETQGAFTEGAAEERDGSARTRPSRILPCTRQLKAA